MICTLGKSRYVIYFLILISVISCAKEQEKPAETKTSEVVGMKLTSSAFQNNGAVPSEYTCDGSDLSPPLSISDVPQNAKSLVLIADDPDAPVGNWDHWVVFNIAPTTKEIPKGTEPKGTAGRNSWGRTGYGGPCPPSGTHRYFFKLYALDRELNFPEGTAKKELEKAMEGHILGSAQLMGTYKRK